MKTCVMSFCNQKGGVGKTSTTALVSYNLAKMGYKCLTVDFDPQANLTSLFIKTKSKQNSGLISIKTSLMTAIKNDINFSRITIPIMDNLDLIPNASDFFLYSRFLENTFNNEIDRVKYLSEKINNDLRDNYDFIFIDVPPTFGLSNDSAFYACDQLVIVLQTQERALDGAKVLVNYLQTNLIDEFNSNVDILGILPVLSKRNAQVDTQVLNSAIQEFGQENIFTNHIMTMERVKRMDITGITDRKTDIWDKKTHKAYIGVANEILKRLGVNE
ncbi:ATPase (plasmid) [Limosilactobacillus reuteri]|uniref:ATPase n=1 Tax=Limosilactobacillus reuteri TaxID=1598 RepID=A0A3M6SGP5_LIMRT|nr:AAA family ATPase [Limosilactobacillus reuteri]MRG90102.1 AAA family ATPase [Limosilactobacillus reuteri]RMX26575.1 ATPase [Limosilactobacillus reuteri]